MNEIAHYDLQIVYNQEASEKEAIATTRQGATSYNEDEEHQEVLPDFADPNDLYARPELQDNM